MKTAGVFAVPPPRGGWVCIQGVWLDESHVENRVGLRNGSLVVVAQRREGPANQRITIFTFRCDCGSRDFDRTWSSKRMRCVSCSRKRSSVAMAKGLTAEAQRAPVEALRRKVRSAMWRERNPQMKPLDKPLRPPPTKPWEGES